METDVYKLKKGDILGTAQENPATHTPQELRENERLKAKTYDLEQENKRLLKRVEEAEAEKRKPGLTVVNEEGEYQRKKRVNSFGISDLLLPPYTKKRVAVYRMCTIDTINPATGLPVEPTPDCIPGSYTLYDKFEMDPAKRHKVMENIIRTSPKIVDGQSVLENEVEDIIFDRGFIQVSVESQFRLYVFLELHPLNKSNKHRPSNAMGVFERMDINTHSRASQSVARDLAGQAWVEIKDLPKDSVMAYALQVVPPIPTVGRPPHEIRDDLKAWAMMNPVQYFKLNKNNRAAIQINIYEAINFGLIEYRPDTKSYLYAETEETLHTHTASEDPMDSFVKSMAKPENKERYDVILNAMNYWGND